MSEIEFRCGLPASFDKAEYPREEDDEIDATLLTLPLLLFSGEATGEDPSMLFLEEGERYIRALLAMISTRLPIECLLLLLMWSLFWSMILENSSCAGEEQEEGVPGRSMAERASMEAFVRRLLALPLMLGVGVTERLSLSVTSVDDPAAIEYCPRGEGLRCCHRVRRLEALQLSSPPSCSSSVVVVS
jgi:hypothetical protein